MSLGRSPLLAKPTQGLVNGNFFAWPLSEDFSARQFRVAADYATVSGQQWKEVVKLMRGSGQGSDTSASVARPRGSMPSFFYAYAEARTGT